MVYLLIKRIIHRRRTRAKKLPKWQEMESTIDSNNGINLGIRKIIS